jgi:hypothetical protein
MPKITIERSDSELYTSYSGLYPVGLLINEHTSLCRRLNYLPGVPSVSHADAVRSYLGLLCTGKSDFEAVDGVRHDDWFKAALSIRKAPSKESLRQRFDRNATLFDPLVQAASTELLERVEAPISPLSTGHVPLDMDVFTMDNSDTRKEGVSRTYQGYDGYAPIGAYLGQEGWCLGLELREGSQHSQKGFVPFLDEVIKRARQLTKKTLLVRLDAAHDALDTLAALRDHPRVSFIVKWNPRREDPLLWRNRAFAEGRVSEPRPGKKVALLTVRETHVFEKRAYRFSRVMRVTERTVDRFGQRLLVPEITVEGWWSSLDLPEDQVIELYKGHGLCEQFHSEIKTELDMERPPSGKFATNALVLSLAGLAYNILRVIGQAGLVGRASPIRNPAKRRRIRTVIQEMITIAGRLIRSGRRLVLRLGRHCPAFEAFMVVHGRFAPG